MSDAEYISRKRSWHQLCSCMNKVTFQSIPHTFCLKFPPTPTHFEHEHVLHVQVVSIFTTLRGVVMPYYDCVKFGYPPSKNIKSIWHCNPHSLIFCKFDLEFKLNYFNYSLPPARAPARLFIFWCIYLTMSWVGM